MSGINYLFYVKKRFQLIVIKIEHNIGNLRPLIIYLTGIQSKLKTLETELSEGGLHIHIAWYLLYLESHNLVLLNLGELCKPKFESHMYIFFIYITV